MASMPGPEDLTNRVVGGYRVLHRLGRGGMSEVYLAFHENLRRHVALKVLRQDLVGSEDHHSRFLQEARAAASLVHPNIVQVYDIGEFEKVHYIAQEYIPGSTLRAYIQRRGRLPIAETISILMQVSAALQKASSVGIVHRDIKPENILLTPDGEAKVADFGLARTRTQDMNLTEIGITLGTPLYMSPEQIQGTPLDSRSDLYSLGVTAFHMLAGKTPFEGDTALALAMQHVNNPPPSLSELRPDVPYTLANIVTKLLAKKADERYSSASSLSRALREVAEALPGRWHGDQVLPFSDLVIDEANAVTTQTMRLQAAMQVEKSRKKTRWLVASGAILAALSFGSLSFLFANQWNRTKLIPSPFINQVSVPRKATVEEQFMYALQQNGIQEWRAIEAYYPPSDINNLRLNLKAWLHLGQVASAHNESLEEARKAFRKIIDRYEENPDQVDELVYVMTLYELMYVERSLHPNSDDWKKLREEAQRSEVVIRDNKKRELLRSLLPPKVAELRSEVD